jgi:hypothetical protein
MGREWNIALVNVACSKRVARTFSLRRALCSEKSDIGLAFSDLFEEGARQLFAILDQKGDRCGNNLSMGLHVSLTCYSSSFLSQALY